ncbi:MAG: YdeI/OmpD-associated family protein [Anaerolineae bacterium]
MAEVPSNSIHPADRAEWRRWLEENHRRGEGVWLISYKKASGKPRLAYEDAIEEALRFGWIDGKAKAIDEERTMLWYSPRKPRSAWSRSNKERVARLTAAGLMTEAGLAKVEAAKRDGSWSRFDGAEALEVPADLAEALDANERARRNFDAMSASVKRIFLGWIMMAKRPETRAARVQRTVRAAAENRRTP